MAHTALHAAAARGDATEVRRLLTTGADVDDPDGQGRTALYVATKVGHLDVVWTLLRAGANANVARTTDGNSRCTSPPGMETWTWCKRCWRPVPTLTPHGRSTS